MWKSKNYRGGGYSHFVTGSDQVWCFGNCKVDGTHYLNFTENAKKIAYAASFGTDHVDEAHRAQAAVWLRQIPQISVREPKGVEIVKELTGRDAQLVLDPTLLLTKEQWSKIAKLPKQRDYILVYVRQRRTKRFDEAVLRLSREMGNLPIIELTPFRSGNKLGKRIVCPGPRQWLGYFINAKYIITHSFHGMAFSLNFNKQFFPLLLEDDPTNSRITGILEQFMLQDRLVTETTSFRDLSDIDYSRVNALLQEKREKSLAFLNNALRGGPSDGASTDALQQ